MDWTSWCRHKLCELLLNQSLNVVVALRQKWTRKCYLTFRMIRCLFVCLFGGYSGEGICIYHVFQLQLKRITSSPSRRAVCRWGGEGVEEREATAERCTKSLACWRLPWRSVCRMHVSRRRLSVRACAFITNLHSANWPAVDWKRWSSYRVEDTRLWLSHVSSYRTTMGYIYIIFLTQWPYLEERGWWHFLWMKPWSGNSKECWFRC